MSIQIIRQRSAMQGLGSFGAATDQVSLAKKLCYLVSEGFQTFVSAAAAGEMPIASSALQATVNVIQHFMDAALDKLPVKSTGFSQAVADLINAAKQKYPRGDWASSMTRDRVITSIRTLIQQFGAMKENYTKLLSGQNVNDPFNGVGNLDERSVRRAITLIGNLYWLDILNGGDVSDEGTAITIALRDACQKAAEKLAPAVLASVIDTEGAKIASLKAKADAAWKVIQSGEKVVLLTDTGIKAVTPEEAAVIRGDARGTSGSINPRGADGSGTPFLSTETDKEETEEEANWPLYLGGGALAAALLYKFVVKPRMQAKE